MQVTIPTTFYTYKEYTNLSLQLFEQEKTTSKDAYYNTPEILALTKLNFARISRLEKMKLNESLLHALKNNPINMRWIVIAESWCGDVAQNLPIIAKMAESSSNIQLHIVLRDENLSYMDAYLTNGGRSIPKLIAYDENNNQLFTWGPRPAALQPLMVELKEKNASLQEKLEKIHTWYAKDKTQELQKEFEQLLKQLF